MCKGASLESLWLVVNESTFRPLLYFDKKGFERHRMIVSSESTCAFSEISDILGRGDLPLSSEIAEGSKSSESLLSLILQHYNSMAFLFLFTSCTVLFVVSYTFSWILKLTQSGFVKKVKYFYHSLNLNCECGTYSQCTNDHRFHKSCRYTP